MKHYAQKVFCNLTIKDRTILLAEYILSKNGTIRDTASAFGYSKTTVHKDLSERLIKFDSDLWKEVQALFSKNMEERHLRGGEAMKNKYKSWRKL